MNCGARLNQEQCNIIVGCLDQVKNVAQVLSKIAPLVTDVLNSVDTVVRDQITLSLNAQGGSDLDRHQFSKVHNALCDLHQAKNGLSNIAPLVAKELDTTENAIRDQFADAYREDNEIFERETRAANNFSDSHGLQSFWSVGGIEDFDAIVPELKNGEYTQMVYTIHSGDTGTVRVDIDPEIHLTCGDLYKLADHLIRASGDEHHIFIEAFIPKGNILELSTGS